MRIWPTFSSPSLFLRILKALVLGAGVFFPVFFVSFPLTIIWVNHQWPGNERGAVAAMLFSLYGSCFLAFVCTVALVWKAITRTPRAKSS